MIKPNVKFLNNELIEQIIAEARILLCKLGVEINNKNVLAMLSDHGAKIDESSNKAIFTQDLIDKALSTVPHSFKLYDSYGNETHNFKDDNVYFTPGSAAITILDYKTNKARSPNTNDYIEYAKVISQLDNIKSQSTALIPADVVEKISDSYRLFLSLLYCSKPVVTGAFTIESFAVMKELQVAIRGTEKELADKPLTIFSCCPTSPLKWSEVTSQNLVDCANSSIPVEFISMPLSGFMAPVTLIGTLVQHTAETISGIIISQFTKPGCPILYGGSPAIFDIRYETTPMGAIETMMIDCAYNEIGKYLGFPTQAYISLSDSKQLDAQAGLESGMGALLAALAGINNISGPGMLDFESCHSIEKLILDNEICGMVLKLIKGIEYRNDFPMLPLFEELLREKHLLISKHTRQFIKQEIYFPGAIIDRANRARWESEGSLSLLERAYLEKQKLIKKYAPPNLSTETIKDLINIMEKEAHRCGMEKLPERL
jgi:trimethylamine--corrinoid protein Co-methyltransferase